MSPAAPVAGIVIDSKTAERSDPFALTPVLVVPDPCTKMLKLGDDSETDGAVRIGLGSAICA